MPIYAERKSAGAWLPPWVRHQHAARYVWAAERTKNAVVLDLGCGDGSGMRAMLLAGALRVDGVDVSADALAEATGTCAPFPDGSYALLHADAQSTEAETEAYDVCVALELIEHVTDPVAFVAEARRVLKPGGLFLCSTPNRTVTNPGAMIADRPYNPFHLREFTQRELCDLLQSHFSSIEWFGQTFFGARYCAALTALARCSKRGAVRIHQFRKVLGAMADSPQKHEVRPWHGRGQPEILLAACRVR